MSLHLDARQRAMLQEMGVHVWWPSPAPAPTLADTAAAPSPPAPIPALLAPRPPAPVAPPYTVPAPRPAPPCVAPVAPDAPLASTAPLPGAPWARVLQAPQPLYPGANAPDTAPADAGWLIVAEGMEDADPLAGEAGRLLDNMLRALRLHRNRRVFLCTLTPLAAGAAPAAPCTDALAQAVASVQPTLVLVMGRAAARAVLGRSEPLGQLRTHVHTVAGVPAVVTYDAPYLLRAPGAKAGAWDDLCRAQSLAAEPARRAAPRPD